MQEDKSVIFLTMAKAAINGDIERVRNILNTGLNYRLAYLYVEAFFQDKIASDLIQTEGKCKCGNVATKWEPGPICPNCRFRNVMKNIEYGKREE